MTLQIFYVHSGVCHIGTERVAEHMGCDVRQRLIRVQLPVLLHSPAHFILNMQGYFWLIVLIQQKKSKSLFVNPQNSLTRIPVPNSTTNSS